MANILVIVSKAVFDKEMKNAQLGDTYRTDRYVSTHKALTSLSEGGTLYLVTVRPGDRLWLVAVLKWPQFQETAWVAEPNLVEIRDITHLIPLFQFSTGKGIQCDPGKLGMSLQTPRVLTDSDVAYLSVEASKSAALLQYAPKNESNTPSEQNLHKIAQLLRLDLKKCKQDCPKSVQFKIGENQIIQISPTILLIDYMISLREEFEERFFGENHYYPVSSWHITPGYGYIQFFMENQGVYELYLKKDELNLDDPPVYVSEGSIEYVDPNPGRSFSSEILQGIEPFIIKTAFDIMYKKLDCKEDFVCRVCHATVHYPHGDNIIRLCEECVIDYDVDQIWEDFDDDLILEEDLSTFDLSPYKMDDSESDDDADADTDADSDPKIPPSEPALVTQFFQQKKDGSTYKNYHGVSLLESDCLVLEILEKKLREPIPVVQKFLPLAFGYNHSNHRVITLGLVQKFIKNFLPIIFELTALKSLHLSSNGIAVIPDKVENLINLEELYLRNNQITTLPASFVKLTSLTHLDLYTNPLKSVPVVLTNMPWLEMINLSETTLTSLPDTLLKLTRLKELHLNQNAFPVFPEIITKMPWLEELSLSFNDLTAVPESIGDLTNLKGLFLHFNKLTRLPNSITKLKLLKELYLYSNEFTSHPKAITQWLNQLKKNGCKMGTID